MAVHTDDVIEFYDYFFNKKYGSCFKLSKTDKNLKQCNDFLTYCNNLHGVTGKFFLFNYFAFQFQYWDEIELKGGSAYSRQIQLSFIIGKKAFDRYKNRNQEYDWQFKSFPVLKKYGLRQQDLIGQLVTKQKIEVKKNGIDTEAAIKLAYYNTPEGFSLCGIYSTLYHHKSTICQQCKYVTDCKKRLRMMYPTLYIDRGYK